MKKKPLEVHVEDAWTYEIPSTCVVTCEGCSNQVIGSKHRKGFGWVGENGTKNLWKLLEGVAEKKFGQKVHITHSPHIKFGPRGVENCQICGKEFNKRGDFVIITDTAIQETSTNSTKLGDRNKPDRVKH